MFPLYLALHQPELVDHRDLMASSLQKLARESVMNQVWEDARLLLAQTCGYPYMKSLRTQGIQLIATPVYGAPLCEVEGVGSSSC